MFHKAIKSFLKDYFTINTRERRGALVMTMIILAQIGYIWYLNYFSVPKEPALAKYELRITAFERMADSLHKQKRGYSDEPGEIIAVKNFSPVFFDPNTASDSVWMQMGFSVKQTAIIRNYINKGGKFRKKEDLARIYSVSNEQFRRILPFIQIAASGEHILKPDWKSGKKEFVKVDINTADTVELCRLPMVGIARARIIYRYRERLGGFVSVRQLLEVYGIDSSVFHAIEPKIVLNRDRVKKINLNGEPLAHPYLSRNVASAIVAYRKQHGDFSTLNDLKQVELVSIELIDKLAPYAAFE